MLLRENVYDSLRADILMCRIAPGDDMREQDLAERYAVSRQPVREALLRLDRVIARAGTDLDRASGDSDDLASIEQSLQRALQEVRQISAGLRLPELEHLNLVETLVRTSSPTIAASIARWPTRRATAGWRPRRAT